MFEPQNDIEGNHASGRILNFVRSEGVERIIKGSQKMAILRMSIPSFVCMIAAALYNLADIWFLGSVGSDAVGTVGACFSVLSALQAIGFLFGYGAGTHVAILRGEGAQSDARHVSSLAALAALVSGITFSLISTPFIPSICSLVGCSAQLTPAASEYLLFILPLSPFFILSFTLSVILRHHGFAAASMSAFISGTLCNILFDFLFIRILSMGIRGAAIATSLSQIVCCLFLLRHLLRHRCLENAVQFLSLIRRFPFKGLRNILSSGLPTFTRQITGALAAVTLTACASRFGADTLASVTIVNRLIFFSTAFVSALGQGFQPICGCCLGAGRQDLVRKGFSFCIVGSVIFLMVCAVAGMIWKEPLLSFFCADSEVIETGNDFMIYYLPVLPLTGFTLITTMTFQALNANRQANILSVTRKGLLYIPMLILMTRFMGFNGLLAALPLAELITFALSFIIATKTNLIPIRLGLESNENFPNKEFVEK